MKTSLRDEYSYSQEEGTTNFREFQHVLLFKVIYKFIFRIILIDCLRYFLIVFDLYQHDFIEGNISMGTPFRAHYSLLRETNLDNITKKTLSFNV